MEHLRGLPSPPGASHSLIIVFGNSENIRNTHLNKMQSTTELISDYELFGTHPASTSVRASSLHGTYRARSLLLIELHHVLLTSLYVVSLLLDF